MEGQSQAVVDTPGAALLRPGLTEHHRMAPPSPEAERLNRLFEQVIKPITRRMVRLMPERGLWLSSSLVQWLVPRPNGRHALRAEVGGVVCDIARPIAGTPRRTLVYYHGGGFAVHLPSFYRGIGQLLANRLQAEVLVPDYRLAPRHRYPAGGNDCFAVYAALLRDGRDARQIGLLGDSAGGNMLLTTLLRIRDAKLALPACAVAISPATDLTRSGRSIVRNAERDYLVPADALPGLVSQYVDAEQLRHPYVSPAFADFTGLPPLAIYVGEPEVLLDDARAVAHAAARDGVRTFLHVWNGMLHCFPLFQALPEGKAALQQIVEFVDAHVAVAPPPVPAGGQLL